MKNRYCAIYVCLCVLLVGAVEAQARKSYFLAATARTGGQPGALDHYDGAILQEGDMAYVTENGMTYNYMLDADGAASGAADGITRIAPAYNPGQKMWVATGQLSLSGNFGMITVGSTDPPGQKPTDNASNGRAPGATPDPPAPAAPAARKSGRQAIPVTFSY